jgi:valine dehydrogenase (NAD+)
VGVEGVGKVGRHLVEHLLADGASVVVSDVSERAVEQARSLGAVDVASVRDLPRLPLDVYAPCALGGSLSDELVPLLQARVVCGAANNQLAHPGVEKVLADLGVLYTPDYVANAGGLVQVGDEAIGAGGFRFDRAKAAAARIFDTTAEVFRLAEAEGVPPAVAADRRAERRMAEVGRLRTVLVPGRP